jgi:hypothetical protein
MVRAGMVVFWYGEGVAEGRGGEAGAMGWGIAGRGFVDGETCWEVWELERTVGEMVVR